MNKKSNVFAKKLKKLLAHKNKLITFGVLLVLIIVIVCLGVNSHKKKVEEANRVQGCSYSYEGYENIASADMIGEKFIAYKNSEGKLGLMKLDGTVTEEAKQEKIYVIEDEWRHYRYIAEGPLSEYPLIIDEETGTITMKQYHGNSSPEETPIWSETKDALIWASPTGELDAVKSGELSLDEGLYPVASSLTTNIKYGYINENLSLDIALVYDKAKDFSSGLAAVKMNGKWGYINSDGLTKIPMDFDDARSFVGSFAVVCKNEKWGIINKSGETVVAFAFDNLLQGENNKYFGLKDGKWCLVEISEEVIAKEKETETTTEPGITVSGGTYVVSTSGSSLNMRASASKSAAVVAQIPNGTEITVTESVSGWAKATYLSYTGWVSADYITEITPAETESQTTDSETSTDI